MKMTLNNPNVDLGNDNVYTKCEPFVLKILNKKQTLTSIKGRNSVENCEKMMHYNPNIDIDIVNDNVYTKFC